VANDELAAAAGIACDRGILVDACTRTSDPAVFAAGDCAVRKLADGTLLRLESVQNATEQGKSAAAALLGQERPFTATAWFWSDQYDKKLQMAGLSTGADPACCAATWPPARVQHVPLPRQASWSPWTRINAVKDHLQARKLLDAGVSPTPEQATDTAFDLATLLQHGKAV
jgi:3-phenylpropionate/trans-cinnamate dioxygenase ferredoxin reductase subunit